MSVLTGDADLLTRPHKKVESEVVSYKASLLVPGADCPGDVARVLEEIHERLFESGLTVEEVKESCGISDNNISSRFRYYVGFSPRTYILKHRLRMAKRLLRKYDMNVSEVAFSVGYESVGSFSTMFKRREECTPSNYRDKAAES